jgi:alpha-1,3-fucosyltransferase
VKGGVDYTEFAPPHSFIDVNDFASPKQLADYLLLLDKTDSLYARYFDWRRDFAVEMYQKRGWCRLCQLANDDQLPPSVYDDILQWWVDDPLNCNLPS